MPFVTTTMKKRNRRSRRRDSVRSKAELLSRLKRKKIQRKLARRLIQRPRLVARARVMQHQMELSCR